MTHQTTQTLPLMILLRSTRLRATALKASWRIFSVLENWRTCALPRGWFAALIVRNTQDGSAPKLKLPTKLQLPPATLRAPSPAGGPWRPQGAAAKPQEAQQSPDGPPVACAPIPTLPLAAALWLCGHCAALQQQQSSALRGWLSGGLQPPTGAKQSPPW